MGLICAEHITEVSGNIAVLIGAAIESLLTIKCGLKLQTPPEKDVRVVCHDEEYILNASLRQYEVCISGTANATT